jgi:nitrite reductase/ring-hydroxylating ferredoxin subunit
VGKVDDFRVGELAPARIPGKDIWQLRRANGTFLPSAPGELHFGLESEVIRCSRHAHEYRPTTGEPLIKGETGRLVRYRVIVEGDRVPVSQRGM